MTFDVCMVTYNSAKWIPACVRALAKAEYDLKCINLYFADNSSTDDTILVLERQKEMYADRFGLFEILRQPENGGFGKGSNAAARAGKGDFVFFYNVDTEIFPDAFLKLEAAIRKASSQTAAFELRQFPYEHPKYYDPVTLETSWISGACFVLKRSVFEETGGFDESVFMYGEDVDLSWHIRALGYRLQYVPAAITWHYAYQKPGEEKPAQIIGSMSGNLVLLYKYGTQKQISDGKKLLKAAQAHIKKDIKAKWEAEEKRIDAKRSEYRAFYKSTVLSSGFVPLFIGLDYEFARAGAFYQNQLPKKNVEFTVVIRTYQRPEVLRFTLESLRNQTHPFFKVVVVEDGEVPQAESVVDEARAWLDITYLAAKARWGRCRAGNEGVARAKTEYVCFLDDDDYFFADHLEVMAHAIEKHPESGFWCAMAVEGRCRSAQRMEFVSKRNVGKGSLRPIDFLADNPVPIQAVVFRKELYQSCGGLDPGLDALEDWDLWMRMICQSPVWGIEKATSIFRVPADEAAFAKRDAEIAAYRGRLFQKMAAYTLPLSAQDVYGLFWQPKKNNEGLDREAWRIKAIGLTNSATWRATHILRRILRTLGAGLRKLAGPESVDFEAASAEDLYAYCIQVEESVCWRFVVCIKNMLKWIKK